MNAKLLCKLLGILALLIGGFMLVSLLWANPAIGQHTHPTHPHSRFESEGFRGLLFGSLIAFAVGGGLYGIGRKSSGKLFRKEAMAVVGLGWLLATILGALPFVLSGTIRGPSIRVYEDARQVQVVAPQWQLWSSWDIVEVSDPEFAVLKVIAGQSAAGCSGVELVELSGDANARMIFMNLAQREPFSRWLIWPGEPDIRAPADRASNYRLRWVPMTMIDAMFEAQSGFSTTGATVLSDLEDPYLVPHCILFWRASTHFLGGLGIIVLFVVILGHGATGKTLMRTEMPGPTQESSTAKIQHAAWLFAAIYVVLNVAQAIIMWLLGMNVFDSLCHTFATMATGGFSTYNASLGHFSAIGMSTGPAIEYVVLLFMILAGTNFTLLALFALGQPGRMFGDSEFRTYMGIMLIATVAIVFAGMYHRDGGFENLSDAIRYGAFQVASIMTTTGFGTADFDQWNQFARGLLLALMFVGGCAGSTGGGVKVIRTLLLFKIVNIELEHEFHPKVVRLLKVGGEPVEDKTLRHTILVYMCFVMVLFALGFLFIVGMEPDATWGPSAEDKLIDSASSIAATLNNIGPGLGIVGATQNYGAFSGLAKIVFTIMMMLGRLEIFPILVLFSPKFWRDQ